MAVAPNPLLIDPPVAGQVYDLPLALIDATDRLREIDEAYAQVMAGSMAERGQRQPVEVVRRGEAFRLVFGGHRYRAAQINGWASLKAVITDATDAEVRLAEIDENLIRRELTKLDRARFLLERKRLYEALNPGSKHGGDRRSDQAAKMATWSFADDIGEKTGLSDRTVQRACEIASRLSPEAIKRITGTSLADHQASLEALAKQPAERQAQALDQMLAAENPAGTVGEALDRIDGRAKPPAPSKAVKAIDLWGRMGARDRREFLAFLADAELPSGCSVEVGQ